MVVSGASSGKGRVLCHSDAVLSCPFQKSWVLPLGAASFMTTFSPGLLGALGVSLLAHLSLILLPDLPVVRLSGADAPLSVILSAASSKTSGTPEAEQRTKVEIPVDPQPLVELRQKKSLNPQPKPAKMARLPETLPEPGRTRLLAETALVLEAVPESSGKSMDEAGETGFAEWDSPVSEGMAGGTVEAGSAANPSDESSEGQGTAPEDLVSEYRYALGRSVLKVSRHYPSWSDMVERDGMARVRLVWRMGEAWVGLQESSGMSRPDEAALSIMREAVARTPLPEALRSYRFEIVLPVEYRRN